MKISIETKKKKKWNNEKLKINSMVKKIKSDKLNNIKIHKFLYFFSCLKGKLKW